MSEAIAQKTEQWPKEAWEYAVKMKDEGKSYIELVDLMKSEFDIDTKPGALKTRIYRYRKTDGKIAEPKETKEKKVREKKAPKPRMSKADKVFMEAVTGFSEVIKEEVKKEVKPRPLPKPPVTPNKPAIKRPVPIKPINRPAGIAKPVVRPTVSPIIAIGKLISEGLSQDEIATKLGMSQAQVSNHIKIYNIKKKEQIEELEQRYATTKLKCPKCKSGSNIEDFEIAHNITDPDNEFQMICNECDHVEKINYNINGDLNR